MNDLKLKITDNQKILETSQNWVETEPSAKPPFQKLILW